MAAKTLQWIGNADGCLRLIDQRQLPGRLVYLDCRDIEQLFDAIKTLAVRGAPAIGVSAGYGLALAMQNVPPEATIDQAMQTLTASRDYLASSRPTAVNLVWALDRLLALATEYTADPDANIDGLRHVVLGGADGICSEDIEMCRRIGQNGAQFITEGCGILTHCNAGALATAGIGTALAPMFTAHDAGIDFRVYADETRPLLQGARLTAWELHHADIDAAVMCDNMAGYLMKQGKIDLVITGADRIAANGDAANKIGTYAVSILAKQHDIPFYVAAPSSTFDLSLATGEEIPIEQRDADEVACFAGVRTTPEDIDVCNPAFDVTEAADIAAIITEIGVIENPNTGAVAQHLAAINRSDD